jgi:hypothetical protein
VRELIDAYGDAAKAVENYGQRSAMALRVRAELNAEDLQRQLDERVRDLFQSVLRIVQSRRYN